MISPTDWPECSTESYTSTDIPEAADTSQMTGMLFSTLLTVFVSVNLCLFILFVLICVFARRIGPETEKRPAKKTELDGTDKNGDRMANVNSDESTQRNDVISVAEQKEGLRHPVDVGDASSSARRARTADDACAQKPAADWRTVADGQQAPEPEMTPTENVYDNQLAIDLAAAMSFADGSAGAVDGADGAPDDDSDDDGRQPDYVNVTKWREAEVNERKSARHDYVNVGDWLEMADTRSQQDVYVNVTADRPPSYLDLFRADAKRKLNAAKRVSKHLVDLVRSSNGQ